ncbi:hypothetical protein [Halalkalibacterium halodurans]|nr:hypothetical protein [Halalkalibacterium halodurans]MDY7224626.1 hypothetical protein [Halalkalibacterium halodurans]MDY7240749.1 hypothetical protein [Halalkalibacterium halodurans]
MEKTAVERAFIGLMEERIHQVAREKAMNDPEYASADEKSVVSLSVYETP